MGDDRWRLGERRARGRGDIAADRRVKGSRAAAKAGEDAPAHLGNPDRLMAPPKALISWSSGKDSAFALHEVMRGCWPSCRDGVDPCGENGEFHTCVLAGPIFSQRLAVTIGECVERDGYACRDLMMD
jgi:hypothetical protein